MAVRSCQRNMLKTSYLIRMLEQDKQVVVMKDQPENLNHKILMKNKEIIDMTQTQLCNWLKLVYDNVMHHNNNADTVEDILKEQNSNILISDAKDEEIKVSSKNFEDQIDHNYFHKYGHFEDYQARLKKSNSLKLLTDKDLAFLEDKDLLQDIEHSKTTSKKQRVHHSESKNKDHFEQESSSKHRNKTHRQKLRKEEDLQILNSLAENSKLHDKIEDAMDRLSNYSISRKDDMLSNTSSYASKNLSHKKQQLQDHNHEQMPFNFGGNIFSWVNNQNLQNQMQEQQPNEKSRSLKNEEDKELFDDEGNRLPDPNDPQESLLNNHFIPENDELKRHREMLQRMEKAYTDLSYINPETVLKIQSNEIQVNIHAATLVILCINKMYQIMLNYGFLLVTGKSIVDTKSIRKLFVHCSKIYITDQMLYVSMVAPKDDLFYKNENDECWKYLMQYYSCVEYPDDHKVLSSYKTFYQNIALGNAFVSKAFIHESKMKKYLYTSLYASYYFFFKTKRLEQNDFFCANPDLDLAREIWNLLESKYIKKVFGKFLPNIRINKKIYIPMTDVVMTLENINDLPVFDQEYKARQAQKNQEKRFDRLARKSNKDSMKIPMGHYIKNEETKTTEQPNEENDEKRVLYGMKVTKHNPETHVKVRVLYNEDLPIDFTNGKRYIDQNASYENQQMQQQAGGGGFFSMFCCAPPRFFAPQPRPVKKVDQLIIHIHGGGFVSMSSSSHQNYTRIWSIDTKTPIISIDYRLSPKNQFPSALDDVWQTYYYVVENAKNEFGIDPKKIIVVGDSAGGNLTAALTIMCIQRNFRKPDGIILCYPALNLSFSDFSPSILLALDDPILPFPFLKMCLESYIGPDPHLSRNPYLSPMKANDDVLKQFPPTRIMIATNDPIRDHGFQFTYKLAQDH
eukprot:403362725